MRLLSSYMLVFRLKFALLSHTLMRRKFDSFPNKFWGRFPSFVTHEWGIWPLTVQFARQEFSLICFIALNFQKKISKQTLSRRCEVTVVLMVCQRCLRIVSSDKSKLANQLHCCFIVKDNDVTFNPAIWCQKCYWWSTVSGCCFIEMEDLRARTARGEYHTVDDMCPNVQPKIIVQPSVTAVVTLVMCMAYIFGCVFKFWLYY